MKPDARIIEETKRFARETLEHAEGGHDWFHTERVYNTAIRIGKEEGADLLVIALSALLHDIADSKFHEGDESLGPKIARKFLFKHNADSAVIEKVISIVEQVSFKNSLEGAPSENSLELKVLQDADRLDAIGAIGIARCFNYGGFKNRKLYDPEIKPDLSMSKEEYKKSNAPTINHFYEKLLLLKDGMHTRTGRKLAEDRHKFMESFLDHFYAEWNGKR